MVRSLKSESPGSETLGGRHRCRQGRDQKTRLPQLVGMLSSGMTVATNAPLAECRIDDRVHRLRRVGQCFVCRSKFRSQVEKGLAEGESYAAIVLGLPEAAALTTRNVSEHWKRGHLPVGDEVFRRIQEDQAEQVGQLVKKAADRKLGDLALAHAVVGRVNERLAMGEVEPTFKDALGAARLLERHDGARQERIDLRRERDEARDALARILSVAKVVMSRSSWSALAQQVDADPALRAFWPAPTG